MNSFDNEERMRFSHDSNDVEKLAYEICTFLCSKYLPEDTDHKKLWSAYGDVDKNIFKDMAKVVLDREKEAAYLATIEGANDGAEFVINNMHNSENADKFEAWRKTNNDSAYVTPWAAWQAAHKQNKEDMLNSDIVFRAVEHALRKELSVDTVKIPENIERLIDDLVMWMDSAAHTKTDGVRASATYAALRAAILANQKNYEAQLDFAVNLLAEWCLAIDEVGTGWDDWDTHYKTARYGDNILRKLIDDKISKIKENKHE